MTGSYILGTAGGGLGPSVNNRMLHTGHSRGLTGAICYPGSAQWEVYSGLDHEHFTPRCEESGPAIHLYFRVRISHLGARKVVQQ